MILPFTLTLLSTSLLHLTVTTASPTTNTPNYVHPEPVTLTVEPAINGRKQFDIYLSRGSFENYVATLPYVSEFWTGVQNFGDGPGRVIERATFTGGPADAYVVECYFIAGAPNAHAGNAMSERLERLPFYDDDDEDYRPFVAGDVKRCRNAGAFGCTAVYFSGDVGGRG